MAHNDTKIANTTKLILFWDLYLQKKVFLDYQILRVAKD